MDLDRIEIYNPPTNKEIEDALSSGRETMWDLFSALKGNKSFGESFDIVKWGTKHEFDLERIVRGKYDEYSKAGRGVIDVHGEGEIDWSEFWEEIRERERIMREILRDLIKEPLKRQAVWEEKLRDRD